MLQDSVFTGAEFLRLLRITRGTLDARTHKGENGYAFGCAGVAHVDEYPAIHAVPVLMTSMLSAQGVSLRIAASVVRNTWETWTPAVMAIEDDPRTKAGNVIPAAEQLFLALSVKVGAHPLVACGTMAECMAQLDVLSVKNGGDFLGPIPVNLHTVLRQLRTNARLAGVELPERFTVSRSDHRFSEWRREIQAYRKAADRRFKAKHNRASRNARAKLRETREPA
jgi:hypothetical protein